MQVVGSILYQGKKVEIVASPKQWEDIKMMGGKLAINQRLLSDFKLVEEAYNKHCKVELGRIIDRQIARLRGKEVEIELEYTDGVKNFKKKTKVSVNSYLKLCGYEQKIDYKIGIYEREWGINELKVGAKNFTLYFNLNLIKFDSGSHIEYVVAHELAHVFFRDHGVGFNDALFKLYPRKSESEYFFNWKMGFLFGKTQDNSFFYFAVSAAVIGLVGYWIYTQFGLWWQNILGGGAGSSTGSGKFY